MSSESEQAGKSGDPVASAERADVERTLRDPRAVVVDVLPRESWERAHIPGAIHLPLAELEDRAETELPDRRAEVIVYCAKPT